MNNNIEEKHKNNKSLRNRICDSDYLLGKTLRLLVFIKTENISIKAYFIYIKKDYDTYAVF